MNNFDEAVALVAGGWDQRYAVCLSVAADERIAAALIDANGDGADINLDQYHRDEAGRWVGDGSSGGAGDTGSSWSPLMVASYGRVEPGQKVWIEYGGHPHEMMATDAGWWLFIAPSEDQDSLPVQVGVH